jgi:DNA modification methylase
MDLYIFKSKKEVILDKEKFLDFYNQLKDCQDLSLLKQKIFHFKNWALSNHSISEETAIYCSYESLLEIIKKILSSKTIERAKYYLKKLYDFLITERENKINDINLARWRDYNEIITDSLWIFDKRDTSGAHLGWYWGNFIPQIPRQLMLRYTKKFDWVLDPFVGSGTTLIECRRLGRNGIGVDINEEVVKKAKEQIEKEKNIYNVKTEIIHADSRTLNFKKVLEEFGIKKVQLVILHPPYWDIIKFSNKEEDLSNSKTIGDFLGAFEEVLRNVIEVLEDGRFLAIVIGDKYSRGEWIPLGFYVMERALKLGLKLKSIVVKNFEETRGKRNQKELWRYRALVGGFYVFKHEYIFIFQKK